MEIIFILRNGKEKKVSFKEGQTVLNVAEENDINLHGNCEGFGVCGGCHVQIENLFDTIPEASSLEEDTLEKVSNLNMNSRLACQIILNSSLDGLRVKLV